MTPQHLRNQNQGLTLGLSRDAAATVTKALSGVPQRDVLLEDVNVQASQFGLVDDIMIAGTSVMASDKSANILMFHPECYAEGARSLGIAMAKNQTVVVKCTLAANGTAVCHVGAQPLPKRLDADGNPMPPPDPTDAGDALAYVFGLGKVHIGAGAVGELSAKATRNCTLGALFADPSASPLDLTIQYIKINNRPMLIGRQDTTIDGVNIGAFSYLATDLDGRVLAQDVEVGDVVTVGILNDNVGALDVYGGIFCMHGDEE